MFGLKLIKKADYTHLFEEMNSVQNLYNQKVAEVTKLEAEIKNLESNIAGLNSKINSLEKSKSENQEVVLLTDVAEKPLTQVKKKNTKKTSTSTRKTVHKANEVK